MIFSWEEHLLQGSWNKPQNLHYNLGILRDDVRKEGSTGSFTTLLNLYYKIYEKYIENVLNAKCKAIVKMLWLGKDDIIANENPPIFEDYHG